MTKRPSFGDRMGPGLLSKDREEATPPVKLKTVKPVKPKSTKKPKKTKLKVVPDVVSAEPLRFTLYMDPKGEALLDAEKRRRRANGQSRRATSFNALVNEAILKYYR